MILAASVHMGKHEGCVADFVKKNRGELERLPCGVQRFTEDFLARLSTPQA